MTYQIALSVYQNKQKRNDMAGIILNSPVIPRVGEFLNIRWREIYYRFSVVSVSLGSAKFLLQYALRSKR